MLNQKCYFIFHFSILLRRVSAAEMKLKVLEIVEIVTCSGISERTQTKSGKEGEHKEEYQQMEPPGRGPNLMGV